MHHNQSCCFFEKHIPVVKIHSSGNCFCFCNYFRQRVSRIITLLFANVFIYFIKFRCIHKSALNTSDQTTLRKQHITTANQLICTTHVGNSTGVCLRRHTECHSGGEVGLDCTCNNICCRSLCGN